VLQKLCSAQNSGVLLLILINLGGLSIVTSPVISQVNRRISAVLKVSEIRDGQRDRQTGAKNKDD